MKICLMHFKINSGHNSKDFIVMALPVLTGTMYHNCTMTASATFTASKKYVTIFGSCFQ